MQFDLIIIFCRFTNSINSSKKLTSGGISLPGTGKLLFDHIFKFNLSFFSIILLLAAATDSIPHLKSPSKFAIWLLLLIYCLIHQRAGGYSSLPYTGKLLFDLISQFNLSFYSSILLILIPNAHFEPLVCVWMMSLTYTFPYMYLGGFFEGSLLTLTG